jgi:hypothetical protein
MNPWSTRSPAGGWFRAAREAAERWRPSPPFEALETTLQESLCIAARAEAPWLFHPSLNAITFPSNGRRLEREFVLAVWTATNKPNVSGQVDLPCPLVAWNRDGGSSIPSGTYDLGQLGVHARATEWPFRIALDVWCHSFGFPYVGSWAGVSAGERMERAGELEVDIRCFMRAMALLESHLPACSDWVSSVTQVAIPLCSDRTGFFHSTSSPDLPGVVLIDLFGGELQILEALVHETAHLHLYRHEAYGPLVAPGHTRTYGSPLRPEPRPLRGIFLAYHALAYICALYKDGTQVGLVDHDDPDIPNLLAKMNDAEATLLTHKEFLTNNGRDLLAETTQVAERVRA